MAFSRRRRRHFSWKGRKEGEGVNHPLNDTNSFWIFFFFFGSHSGCSLHFRCELFSAASRGGFVRGGTDVGIMRCIALETEARTTGRSSC